MWALANALSYFDNLEWKLKLYFGFGFQIKQETGSAGNSIPHSIQNKISLSSSIIFLQIS